MWAIGIIMYQMLTGRHPFHVAGDDEKSYISRISKESVEQIMATNVTKYKMSSHVRDLLAKLLVRGISDRYTVEQVMKHPWVTRNANDPIPMT